MYNMLYNIYIKYILDGSRISERGLTQSSNFVGEGVWSTLPSMQSMVELGGWGHTPQKNV